MTERPIFMSESSTVGPEFTMRPHASAAENNPMHAPLLPTQNNHVSGEAASPSPAPLLDSDTLASSETGEIPQVPAEVIASRSNDSQILPQPSDSHRDTDRQEIATEEEEQLSPAPPREASEQERALPTQEQIEQEQARIPQEDLDQARKHAATVNNPAASPEELTEAKRGLGEFMGKYVNKKNAFVILILILGLELAILKAATSTGGGGK